MRKFKSYVMDAQAAAASLQGMENGEICCICEEQFAEDYGRPMACENCGGDGVLEMAMKSGVKA